MKHGCRQIVMGQKIRVNQFGFEQRLRTSLGSGLGWTVALPHFVLRYFAPRDFARLVLPPLPVCQEEPPPAPKPKEPAKHKSPTVSVHPRQEDKPVEILAMRVGEGDRLKG